MDSRQEQEFWNVIKIFDDINILPHVMIIGSWAEYLYKDLFKTNFIPNLRTRDMDFLYRNINLPKEEVPLLRTLEENGFVRDIDFVTGVVKFYKEDLIELEFLTRALGSSAKSNYDIKPLGIKSEGLRDVNILADYPLELSKNDYDIIVPEPAAYILQKLLINEHRVPAGKKEKDIEAVRELLYHVNKSKQQREKLKLIYDKLSKKQKNIVDLALTRNDLVLFED